MRKYGMKDRLMFRPDEQNDGLGRFIPTGYVTVVRLFSWTDFRNEPIYEVLADDGEVYCAYESELTKELTGARRALMMAGAATVLLAVIGFAGWIEGLS